MTGNPVLHAIARESAPLGKLFINAIKMVVIPLVVTIIFASIARLGDVRKLGKIGGMTLGIYWVTLVRAIMTGMGVMALGLQFTPDIKMPAIEAASIPKLQSITDFIISLIPSNPFAAASRGAILPLIVFTALFAAAAGTLEEARRERMITGAEDISEALIKLVWWILYTAPLGIFGLIAPATALLGWGLIQSLGIFIACVFIGLTLFICGVLIPLLLIFGKMTPRNLHCLCVYWPHPIHLRGLNSAFANLWQNDATNVFQRCDGGCLCGVLNNQHSRCHSSVSRRDG